MNPQEQNQNPAPQEKSFGATIGIIVIVIVLVLGALYFWGGTIKQSADDADTDYDARRQQRQRHPRLQRLLVSKNLSKNRR